MIILDKTNFETEVLQGDGYILVDFFGDGCAPCEALMPHVMELSEKYGDKLKFTKLNTTKARRVSIGQKVLGLPVIAIYKNGEKVEELIKEDATPDKIEVMIQKYI
ncbi:MAG: thioredoxin family protein [Sedimentibacter sp.]